jgi:hypothetical protein
MITLLVSNRILPSIENGNITRNSLKNDIIHHLTTHQVYRVYHNYTIKELQNIEIDQLLKIAHDVTNRSKNVIYIYI